MLRFVVIHSHALIFWVIVYLTCTQPNISFFSLWSLEVFLHSVVVATINADCCDWFTIIIPMSACFLILRYACYDYSVGCSSFILTITLIIHFKVWDSLCGLLGICIWHWGTRSWSWNMKFFKDGRACCVVSGRLAVYSGMSISFPHFRVCVLHDWEPDMGSLPLLVWLQGHTWRESQLTNSSSPSLLL